MRINLHTEPKQQRFRGKNTLNSREAKADTKKLGKSLEWITLKNSWILEESASKTWAVI